MTFLIVTGLGVAVAWWCVWAYRQRWGCRFGIHHYEAAFPATHFHGECVKCGKRIIRRSGVGAPIDQRWLETGVETVMGPPRQPPRKPRAERKEDV